MSHFSVLVIGENVEEQLSPYDENSSVNEYFVKEVSEKDKKEFIEFYNTLQTDKDYGIKSQEEIEENKKLSFKQLYKKYGDSWNGNIWKEKKGVWEEYSTYNPKSKWDWFEVGGRWAGMFKLKKGRKGHLQKPHILKICKELDKERVEENKKLTKEKRVDSAYKKDIDFSPDVKEFEKNVRFWELYVEGKKPKNKEEREMIKDVFYNKKYYLDRYKTKGKYAQQLNTFSTFAVLKNGEWIEQGQMGWFGCSSATDKEEYDWVEEYYNNFIKDLPEDTLLTIVDCHI